MLSHDVSNIRNLKWIEFFFCRNLPRFKMLLSNVAFLLHFELLKIIREHFFFFNNFENNFFLKFTPRASIDQWAELWRNTKKPERQTILKQLPMYFLQTMMSSTYLPEILLSRNKLTNNFFPVFARWIIT